MLYRAIRDTKNRARTKTRFAGETIKYLDDNTSGDRFRGKDNNHWLKADFEPVKTQYKAGDTVVVTETANSVTGHPLRKGEIGTVEDACVVDTYGNIGVRLKETGYWLLVDPKFLKLQETNVAKTLKRTVRGNGSVCFSAATLGCDDPAAEYEIEITAVAKKVEKRFPVGSWVRLIESYHGPVKVGEVGLVKRDDGFGYVIDFPSQNGWCCSRPRVLEAYVQR